LLAKESEPGHPERAGETPGHAAARASHEAQQADGTGKPDDDGQDDAEDGDSGEGTAAKGQGRHPGTGQFRRREIAAGYGLDGNGMMNYQPGLSPVLLADLATVSGADGPLCASIAEHQGTARVQMLDAATASAPALAGQLGRNAPSGIPGQPPPFVAPSGVGAEFRVSPRGAY